MNRGFKDLFVHKKAFSLANKIFVVSKQWPKEEIYSLTSQIRNSSRSVCSNLAEGYRKRQYRAHFISKLSDADMENGETQVWLDFAYSSTYVNRNVYQELNNESQEIGRLLNDMIENPEKYKRRKND